MEEKAMPFDYNFSISNETTTNIGDLFQDNSTRYFPYPDHDSSSHDYYDYYYMYYEYYYLEIYAFEIYALGIVQPCLVLLATLTNFFVAIYFLMKKNRKKTSNVLFICIAFSDTMTGVTLLPNAFGVYARDFREMSREWCNSYMIQRLYVSPVFHTVSIWETLLLCFQRYICICHPFKSGRVCTFWKTFISVIVIYCSAAVLHLYHLVDNKVGHGMCEWLPESPCKETCIYLWFSVVLQYLLPCLLLIILTSRTIKELRKSQRRMSQMTNKRKTDRLSRERIITYTAALVVLFFLIPELPYGIYNLLILILTHADLGQDSSITVKTNHIFLCGYELALTLSFCANFWIYCCMIRDFRWKILELLSCGIFKRRLSHLWSHSGSFIGGSRKQHSRSSSSARVHSKTASMHSTSSTHAAIPLTTMRIDEDDVKIQEMTSPRVNHVEENEYWPFEALKSISMDHKV